MKNGDWVTQVRECYDRGDGAGILLYNKEKQTVILTRQFRMPTYMNDNHDGFLIEICAGLLDKDQPEACIIRETEEEVGYRLKSVKKVYESYSSPGVMTEKMHFFILLFFLHPILYACACMLALVLGILFGLSRKS